MLKEVTNGATYGDLSWLKLSMGYTYCFCEQGNDVSGFTKALNN